MKSYTIFPEREFQDVGKDTASETSSGSPKVPPLNFRLSFQLLVYVKPFHSYFAPVFTLITVSAQTLVLIPYGRTAYISKEPTLFLQSLMILLFSINHNII